MDYANVRLSESGGQLEDQSIKKVQDVDSDGLRIAVLCR